MSQILPKKSKRERLMEALQIEDDRLAKKLKKKEDEWHDNRDNLAQKLLSNDPRMILNFHSVYQNKIRFQYHHEVNIQEHRSYYGQKMYEVYCELDLTHPIFQDKRIAKVEIKDVIDDLQFKFIRTYDDTYY